MSIVTANCNRCGETLEVETIYFQKYGSVPYCDDCRIHTQCTRCGEGIRLQPSRYQDLGGDPLICTSCDDRKSNQHQSSGWFDWFWPGLTIGEKIVLPIATLALIGALVAVIWDPELTVSRASSALAWPIVIIALIVHYGEKRMDGD